MTARLEVPTVRGEVVDLAVEDCRHRAVLRRNRLIARLEVDHAQPGDPERDPLRDVEADRVGPAVPKSRHHAGQDVGIGPLTRPDYESGNAAHDVTPPRRAPGWAPAAESLPAAAGRCRPMRPRARGAPG